MEIHTDIVSPKHPLFATVDHIIPLSMGGRNSWRNRALAHNLCNNVKGNRTLTDSEKLELQDKITRCFKNVARKQRREAARRAGITGVPNLPRKVHSKQLAVWEDDGGAIS